MRVLVVGSGGREHALCWAIKKSPLCEKLYCAPGNAGIAEVAECLDIAADKIYDLIAVCHLHRIDFVVIGPELPLTLGLADELRGEGIACFGPSKAAADIEGSKIFMKDVCARAKVPTAVSRAFSNVDEAKVYVRKNGAPIVVKADGLAAGKGVTVARTIDEAIVAIDEAMTKKVFGEAGASVIIEEFMEGEEVSFFVLCDGENAVYFAAAQDHKAVYDGDKGPNTGGMGAYSPAPIIDAAMQARIMNDIINPTVKALRDMGRPFTGVLFAGLMMTQMGPKVVEFNARFGDPETEAILPRLKTDLLALLYAVGKGLLDGVDIQWYDRAALSVIMASSGYPGPYKKGTVVHGLDQAATVQDAVVFHAGTARNIRGETVATGGRVLAVTGCGSTIAEAQASAYKAIDKINWPEGFCRRDIGWRAVKQTEAA
jgi:phosphoribosylamine---glycine ligase